jgi:uncharacterized protein YgiB involved in biofilm formation
MDAQNNRKEARMSLFRTDTISTKLTEGPVDAMARETHAGMAHWAGSGPFYKTCGECKHRGYQRQSRSDKWNERLQQMVPKFYSTPACKMFKKLTGRHGPKIDKKWKACKYFVEKG